MESSFHGYLTRKEADNKLLPDPGNPGKEGTFLVRHSETSPGDFVISVLVHVKGPEVIHYQIRRHGKSKDDSLFSLAEKKSVVIQGLDELIRYYRFQPNNGLQHPLSTPLEGTVSPPPEVLLHGTENLLHRAAANGELTIVSELLKSGYRNVSAKNHDGQTATHLAAFYGFDRVIQELHKYNAPVNVADSSGYSPLHFACQANQPNCVKVLLEEAGADPTFRNQLTGWVPLHEAAWKGYTKCCQILIAFGSPALPRTPKNETPGDIARANSHIALATILDSNAPKKFKTSLSNWYHPDIDRQEAIRRLNEFNHGVVELFLFGIVKKAKTFVLTLAYEQKFHNFEIYKKGIYYFLKEGPYLISLEHVVDHYTKFSDGLPTQLCISVSPPDVPMEKKIKFVYQFASYSTSERSNSSGVHSRNKVIGGGEFGLVYQGVYQSEEGTRYTVAIKVLNEMGERQTKDFLREANVMMSLDHPCVVQLIGISCGPPILMVLELVPLGSLLEYLIDQKKYIQSSFEIALWAGQIASGMVYLASKKFVHRDLAARNILLASKFQAKISDFGLSRSFMEDKDYYKASEGGRWPLKWYAPECVNYGTFSSASDVWSYGILLWEIYSFGSTPYENMNGSQTIQFVENGKRLSCPEGTSPEVYAIMNQCWKYKASERPTFDELWQYFSKCSDYINIKELALPSEEE
nr:LOW QUALITY PROTEIN: tyrosine-protein kinase Shark-like [Lepeophtheirus salmonis]